jgi:hypothetical protein
MFTFIFYPSWIDALTGVSRGVFDFWGITATFGCKKQNVTDLEMTP